MLDGIIGSPQERFAAEAMRIARRAPGVQSATYDRAQFAIALQRTGERSPAWVYLSNIFQETASASRTERRRRIEHLISMMSVTRAEDSWDTVRLKLRPVLRPATFGLDGPAGMLPPVSRPAMPFVRELVVVDMPDSMSYVTPNRLEFWAVTAEEVFATARANLAEIARRSLDRPWPGDDNLISMIDDGDGYFTSLPLAPGWLAEVAEQIGSPILAFLPDTNTLLLCPLADGDLTPVYGLVEQHYQEAVRSLTPVGYIAAGDGRVRPYAPPAGHPHEGPARRAEAVLAAAEYGAQTDWLTKQYAEGGIDVYVGRLLAVEPPGGLPAETIATWTDGITSLLPSAQSICFARHDGSGIEFRAPWQVVADELGLRPEPLLAPARYRVGAWPPPAVMDILRASRID